MTKQELLRYELYEGILANVFIRVVPWLAQLAWRRRMTPRRREQIWIREKWALLIWQLGPITMLPFAWITRRHRGVGEGLRAIVVGFVAGLGSVLVSVALLYAVEFIFDFPDEDAVPSSPPADVIPAQKGVR